MRYSDLRSGLIENLNSFEAERSDSAMGCVYAYGTGDLRTLLS